MSEVNFGKLGNDYNFYQKNEQNKPKAEEKEQNAPISAEDKSVPADKVLDALDFLGVQKFASVSAKNSINPADFLSEDRISSIEESMKLFEEGVEKYASAINDEFGDLLDEQTTLSLAANMMIKE